MYSLRRNRWLLPSLQQGLFCTIDPAVMPGPCTCTTVSRYKQCSPCQCQKSYDDMHMYQWPRICHSRCAHLSQLQAAGGEKGYLQELFWFSWFLVCVGFSCWLINSRISIRIQHRSSSILYFFDFDRLYWGYWKPDRNHQRCGPKALHYQE